MPDAQPTMAMAGRHRVRNPRTGQYDYSFVPPGAEEVGAICAALRAHQPSWCAGPLEARIAVLRRWADAIEQATDEIAAAEFQDTGRYRRSMAIPGMVVRGIRSWCDRAPAIIQAAMPSGASSVMPGVTFETQLVPFGLLGVISPWNQPFLLSTMDAIPALLAGCAAIIKPSEITPRFIEPVMNTVRAVPELARVLRFVPGDGSVGQAMIAHVDVQVFTGSVTTGRKVLEECARRFVPVFLELGGKDALVVTATADLERAATVATRASVLQTGQICFATERVYVQDIVHDRFVALMIKKANAIRMAYPDHRKGDMNPFILERQADIVDAHLDDAIERGGQIVAGGKSIELGGGRYMPATVVTGVTHEMRIMREETFGPVTPIMRYGDEDEGVALANDSEYGLSGAVIAGTVEEARRIGLRMNAGAITLQDAAMTEAILRDAEKSQFNRSGMGTSRIGPGSLLRYFRKKVLVRNTAPTLTIHDVGEEGSAHP